MSQPPASTGCRGACSVCHGIFRLKGDGTVYRHGGKGRGSECPGSFPSSQTGNPVQPVTGSIPVPGAATLAPGRQIPSVPDLEFLMSGRRYRLIEHIPKSARNASGCLLSTLIDKVVSDPSSLDAWEYFLSFGPAILSKPRRGGRKINVTNTIKKRIADFKGPTSIVYQEPGNYRQRDHISTLASAVSSKIEQGNLKAAVRLICSDEPPAAPTAESARLLQVKHPSAHADRRQLPDLLPPQGCLSISSVEITKAVMSFPNGSSGGLDCLRPQHLKDLVSGSERCERLAASIAGLVNLLFQGSCPGEVQKVFFGGNLIALSKKDGGVRPIAVGSVWRRLAAKCANTFAADKVAAYLAPTQLGVGVSGGAEAAAHVGRRYLDRLGSGNVFIKLDFRNAFNTLRRDAMLEAVLREVPEIYNFCNLAYLSHSYLYFHEFLISSEEGPQQGDPLGPLLFSISLHPILKMFTCELVMGYLDDISAGGTPLPWRKISHLSSRLPLNWGWS